MFSLRRLALSSTLRTSLNPSTLRASRPANLQELNSFTALLSRRLNSYDAGMGLDGPMRRPYRGERTVPATPTKVLYVGNLRYEATDQDLATEFGRFGTVMGSRIVRFPDDGRSRGYGYVEFETEEQAASAIQAMDQSPYMGRRLSVQYVQRQSMTLAPNPPSTVLFIGNLPFQITDDDLNELFKNVNGCHDVRVAMDRRTGQPRGFAHADFKDVESAAEAKEILKGTMVYGRTIRVDFSANRNMPGQQALPRQSQYSQSIVLRDRSADQASTSNNASESQTEETQQQGEVAEEQQQMKKEEV